jgi:hypothetical protein
MMQRGMRAWHSPAAEGRGSAAARASVRARRSAVARVAAPEAPTIIIGGQKAHSLHERGMEVVQVGSWRGLLAPRGRQAAPAAAPRWWRWRFWLQHAAPLAARSPARAAPNRLGELAPGLLLPRRHGRIQTPAPRPQGMEGWAARELPRFLKDSDTCWQPSDWLPEPSSPDFQDQVGHPPRPPARHRHLVEQAPLPASTRLLPPQQQLPSGGATRPAPLRARRCWLCARRRSACPPTTWWCWWGTW